MSKKIDTIEIQTSSIAFLEFDGRLSKTKSNSQWKLKCMILAVRELSELVCVLCTKSRSVLCIRMGIHRNEIRS